jgi:thiol-disulfide isomerase/thioredoxin
MKLTAKLILPLFLLLSCISTPATSYDEALNQCDSIIIKLKNENPKELFFLGPKCLIGAELPLFNQTSKDQIEISNQSLKGKLSIINFWFITCPPCIAEIPGLNKIVKKYGTDEINYIAIGRDNKRDIEEFLLETDWNFQHIMDGAELIKDTFNIKWGFPTTFVLNKDAEIIEAFSGGKSDSTAIQQIQDKLIPIIEKGLKR